ncbi:hypothetical protein VTK73DRAFT_4295 [Phialemonium thermophilum]|uniref:Transposase n=1 Tax=Phialemonium thermophilum TaxID=223376 RepID=A0ABR3WUN4_9PEZI
MPRPKGAGGTKQLTQEQRQRVRTLFFDAKLTKAHIQSITGYTPHQIRYAIRSENTMPGSRTGRPRSMSPLQEEELIKYVCASKDHRRMSFLQLSTTVLDGAFSIWAIKNALYRYGFRRRVARVRYGITEEVRKLRLDWAREHVEWTPEQWAKVVWVDASSFAATPHPKQYVTRRDGEEWDPTCIVEKHELKVSGWLFSGCFSALGKGPGVLWKKDWGDAGTISSAIYAEHLLPMVESWIQATKQQLGEHIMLLREPQAGGGIDATKLELSKADLEERGVTVLELPPCSSDLDPVESCWDWMKDYIEDKYGLEDRLSYEKLASYVNESWEALPHDLVRELLGSMKARCEAVIAANGMHTKS